MNDSFTFGLVHGAWHRASCWELARAELRKLGYESHAINLPIGDPDATFDDYADTVVGRLKDAGEVVLVGHSRAGNVIPRAAGRLAIKRLIFLCPSFEKATTGRPNGEDIGKMPERNTEDFTKGKMKMHGNLTRFDPALAEKVFYNECTDGKLVQQAVRDLRAQRRSEEESPLLDWPKVPQSYIICTEDQAIRPDWSRYVARNWLGLEPVEIPGDHSPFLSYPRLLAETLVTLANGPEQ